MARGGRAGGAKKRGQGYVLSLDLNLPDEGRSGEGIIMARYEHLPIYKTAMDLAVYVEQVMRNFSRYHK